MAVTLVIKKVQTAPLKIAVSVPGLLSGHFTGHAKIRSKPDNKALLERVEQGDFTDDDNALLHELYDSFEGLPNMSAGNGEEAKGDDAWKEMLEGPLSSYLSSAATQAYYAQYGEARQGNSGRRR